jgi:transcriptional regulator with XRE-family HTH domain
MGKSLTPLVGTIGGRIRLLRGRLAQAAFADRFGLGSQATVSAIEIDTTPPRLELVSKLVAELDVDARWLLTGEGEPFPKGPSAARPEAVVVPRQPATVISRNVREVRESGQLYNSLIQVVGSFAPDMGVLRSADTPEEGTAPYAEAGPFPEDTIALRTAAAIFGMAAGACLILGPAIMPGETGFGLVTASGVGDVLCAWARRARKIHLYMAGDERILRLDQIREARAFLGIV